MVLPPPPHFSFPVLKPAGLCRKVLVTIRLKWANALPLKPQKMHFFCWQDSPIYYPAPFRGWQVADKALKGVPHLSVHLLVHFPSTHQFHLMGIERKVERCKDDLLIPSPPLFRKHCRNRPRVHSYRGEILRMKTNECTVLVVDWVCWGTHLALCCPSSFMIVLRHRSFSTLPGPLRGLRVQSS